MDAGGGEVTEPPVGARRRSSGSCISASSSHPNALALDGLDPRASGREQSLEGLGDLHVAPGA